jgi:hypothetical protein
MSAVTIYSLFFDDIRTATVTVDKDSIFYGITSFSMFMFAFEITLACIAKEGYFNSFFFWLDFVSTVTMIPDIGWIWFLIVGQGSTGQVGNAAQLAKTSRAGRITRVIRVIRLIRLIRIVKLYKSAKMAQEKREQLEKEAVQVLKRKNPIVAGPKPSMGGIISGNSESKDEILRQKSSTNINARQSQNNITDNILQLPEAIEEKKEEDEDSLDKEFEQIDNKGNIEKQPDRSSMDHSGIPKKSVTIKEIEDADSSKPAEATPVVEENHSDDEDEDMPMESNISKNLSDRTIKIVIILVLMMLFILPLFSIDMWVQTPTMHD